MSAPLQVIEHDSIREIRLDRPDVHNAFDVELIEALTREFTRAGDDAGCDTASKGSVRGVLLSAAGKSFCAGADLNYMKSIAGYGPDENRADALRLSRMFLAIRQCPVFVLARVQGATLGGGTGLVAACDYVIAAERARFGFSEVKLGIIPSVISPFVLDRIGPAQGRALFPTGMRFDAERALRIGLVDEVVPDDALDEAVERVLGELLSAAPNASREAKALAARVGRHLPLDLVEDNPVFTETADGIARLRGGEEGQEGMASFLEKRRPHWVPTR